MKHSQEILEQIRKEFADIHGINYSKDSITFFEAQKTQTIILPVYTKRITLEFYKWKEQKGYVSNGQSGENERFYMAGKSTKEGYFTLANLYEQFINEEI